MRSLTLNWTYKRSVHGKKTKQKKQQRYKIPVDFQCDYWLNIKYMFDSVIFTISSFEPVLSTVLGFHLSYLKEQNTHFGEMCLFSSRPNIQTSFVIHHCLNFFTRLKSRCGHRVACDSSGTQPPYLYIMYVASRFPSALMQITHSYCHHCTSENMNISSYRQIEGTQRALVFKLTL